MHLGIIGAVMMAGIGKKGHNGVKPSKPVKSPFRRVVLVFGNEMLEYDNLAPRLADELVSSAALPGVEFIKCSSMNDVLDFYGKKGIQLYILDVVKGIDKVVLFDDIDRLEVGSMVSLHDFDLGYFLKLMKKMGRIDRIKIIGIPIEGDIKKIKVDVRRLLG